MLVPLLCAPIADAAGFLHTQAFQQRTGFCRDKGAWLTYNASGAGTAASPYLICNAAQLANIGIDAAAVNKVYKLMGDIDLAPYYAVPNAQFRIANCGAGCAPWDGATNFTGTFDGNGFTIKNFTYISPGTRGVGLFASTWGNARIKNLRMTNVNVSGGTESGGLVGNVSFSAIDNCHVQGTVTGNDTYVGGIVGVSYHLALSNSSFSGTVSNTGQYTGGAVGAIMESIVYAVKTSGVVTSTTSVVGGLVGRTGQAWGVPPGIISNSYSTANVTGTSEVGGVAGHFDSYASRSRIIRTYATGTVTGTSRVGGLVGLQDGGATYDSYATGTVNGMGGSGQVKRLIGRVENAGVISNSYYLSTSACDSTGASGACGANGTGHAALSDFYSSANAPMSSWDKVRNTGDGPNDFWAFSGSGHAKLWNEDTRAFKPPFPGSGTLASPYLISTVAHFNAIAQNPRWTGAEFRLSANIDFASGAFNQVGGSHASFSGHFDGNNFSLSNIVNNQPGEDRVGVFGLVRISNIHNLTVNNVNISGAWEVGGLVGLFDTSSMNDVRVVGGTVTGSGNYVGGVFGRATKNGSSHQMGNTANVTGVDYVGGIGGEQWASSDIERVFNRGNISGAGRVGGLFGNLSMNTLRNGYSTGTVTGTADRVGGLVGELSSQIERSYSTGAVTGVNAVGGVVGAGNGSAIVRSFATGAVTGQGDTAEVGFVRGTGTGAFTHAYYWAGLACDSTGSGGSCNTNATGSHADITNFHTQGFQPVSGFSVPGTWTLVGGSFPKLTWEP